MKTRLLGPALLALLPLSGGCYIKTQRLPGPMESRVRPLPPGTRDHFPPGPEEVVVVRHADPVQILPAGLASSFPLPYYDRQARLSSGSWVFSGAGGRLEVLWPDGNSLLLFDRGTGVVGSESRGEPIFFFREVQSARLMLRPGARVELLGGPILSVELGPDTDESARVGPFVVEQIASEVQRVINRGKASGRIAFRTELFDLDPGYAIDLPLLEVGGAPIAAEPGFRVLPSGVETRGEVDSLPFDGGGERLSARGEHELRGFGVRVRLDEGDEAIFLDLADSPFGREVLAPEPPPAAPAPEETVDVEREDGVS